MKQLLRNINTCHIYVGFTMMTYDRNIGINICAVDMLDALPTDKKEILQIAHNSNYGCRFILECSQNVKPIVKSNRSLQIKASYYHPKAKKKINIIVKGSYKFVNAIKRFW